MTLFATVDDYVARYGEVDDPGRLAALLGDATAFIDSYPGFTFRGDDMLQAANLVRVCCSVVYRSLSAGDLAGVSSYSQGGVGYSASVTLSNPSGDFYLTASEKRSLGIGRGRIGATCPYSGEAVCRAREDA